MTDILCYTMLSRFRTVVSAIRRAGQSEAVSQSDYWINSLTGVARLYTTLAQPAWELVVVANLAAQAAANLAVVATIIKYRRTRQKTE